MNLGGLLLLFLVMIGAIGGLYLVLSKTPQASEVTDTYGAMAGNATNESQAAVGNLTGTGISVGTGAVVFVVLIGFAVVLGALVLVVAGKKF